MSLCYVEINRSILYIYVVVGGAVLEDVVEDAGLEASGMESFPMGMALDTATGAGKNPSGGCGMLGAGTKALPSGAKEGPGLGPGNIIVCRRCACPCSACALGSCGGTEDVTDAAASGATLLLSVPSAGPKCAVKAT